MTATFAWGFSDSWVHPALLEFRGSHNDGRRAGHCDTAENKLAEPDRDIGSATEDAQGFEGRPTVFISYRRANRDAAVRLNELLEERGVSAWYDALMTPGADWRDAIVEKLSTARVMVILLSSAALDSEELKKELAVAAQERVPFIVARLEEVRPTKAFAYELARVNWIDVFDDPHTRLNELADDLERLVNRPERIPVELGASLKAQRIGRRRERLRRDLLHNHRSQLVALLAISILQFLLYDQLTSAVDRLIEGGVAPLRAFAYVAIAVSAGSPLILLTVLRGGLSAQELPVLATASLNTLILGLLLDQLLRALVRRLTPRKNKRIR